MQLQQSIDSLPTDFSHTLLIKCPICCTNILTVPVQKLYNIIGSDNNLVNTKFTRCVHLSQTFKNISGLLIKKEKTMDPATLAATATTLLAPYLAKLGKSLMDESGARLPETVSKLWELITARFKGNPTASGAANDLAQKADDIDNQEAFALQLKKLLKNDEEFAGALQSMLKEAQGQISNVGDGAVATNGSIGVGKIEIGGDVSGNIVVGNNNQVSDGRGKKK